MTTLESSFNTITINHDDGTLNIETHKPKERKAQFTIPIGAIDHLSKNIAYSPTTVGVVIHLINDVKHPPKMMIKGDRYAMLLSRRDAKTFREEVEALIPQFKGTADDWKPYPQTTTYTFSEMKQDLKENFADQPTDPNLPESNVDFSGIQATYRFGNIKLKGRTITYQHEDYDIYGARALVDAGQLGKRMTATRVVGGGVLFGPVGVLLGGMAKKSTGDAFLNIELSDGRLIIEPVKKKDIKDANKFAKRINDLVLKM